MESGAESVTSTVVVAGSKIGAPTKTVTDMRTGKPYTSEPTTQSPFDTSGGGGDDGGMDHERRIAELEKIVPTLATKTDISALPTSADLKGMRDASDLFRAEIKAEFHALRADFAKATASISDVRADIQKSITENTRWTHSALWGILGTFLIGLLGLLFTIYNATKPSAQKAEAPVASAAPAQQPIVITLPVPQAAPAPIAPTAPPRK